MLRSLATALAAASTMNDTDQIAAVAFTRTNLPGHKIVRPLAESTVL